MLTQIPRATPGNRTGIVDGRGKTHTYVYNGLGMVEAETNAVGATMGFYRDEVNRRVTVTNRNGSTYTDYEGVRSIDTNSKSGGGQPDEHH